jgi:hypothetical protein
MGKLVLRPWAVTGVILVLPARFVKNRFNPMNLSCGKTAYLFAYPVKLSGSVMTFGNDFFYAIDT